MEAVHIEHIPSSALTTYCGRTDRDLYECSRCGAHDETEAGPWVQCGTMLHRSQRIASCRATPTEPIDCAACQRIRDAREANGRASEHRKLARSEALRRERARRMWPDDWGKMHPSERSARNVYARSGT